MLTLRVMFDEAGVIVNRNCVSVKYSYIMFCTSAVSLMLRVVINLVMAMQNVHGIIERINPLCISTQIELKPTNSVSETKHLPTIPQPTRLHAYTNTTRFQLHKYYHSFVELIYRLSPFGEITDL